MTKLPTKDELEWQIANANLEIGDKIIKLMKYANKIGLQVSILNYKSLCFETAITLKDYEWKGGATKDSD